MPSYRRHRDSTTAHRTTPRMPTSHEDPWSCLPLFPHPAQIADASRAISAPPPPADIHAHLVSTYRNGVEPSIHIIPSIMESTCEALRSRQVTKAMESLKFIEKWVPCRAKLAVLHEIMCQAILVSNFEIVNRILVGHGFITLFFEVPIRLAADVKPVEMLEALVASMMRYAEVDKIAIARALRVDIDHEMVNTQVRMNIAGIVTTTLDVSTDERVVNLLQPALIDFVGEYRHGALCSVRAFEKKAARVYKGWLVEVCRRVSNKSFKQPIMPVICEDALDAHLKTDGRSMLDFNPKTCRYEWVERTRRHSLRHIKP